MKLLFSNLILNSNIIDNHSYKLWTSIYKTTNPAVSIIDRSEYSDCPINYKILETSKIPTHQYVNQTYEEIINARCQEILNLDRPITVLWSGGIDSTLVIASLLKNFDKTLLNTKVNIALTLGSIIENPYFYRNFILPNFDLVSSELLPHHLYNNSRYIITGELNDQLLGKALMTDWNIKYGENSINNLIIPGQIAEFYVSKGLTDDEAEFWVNNICQSATSSNVILKSFADYFWWFNFCFFWQDTSMRIYCLTPPHYANDFATGTNNCIHFYNAPDLQLWSINNPDLRKFVKWADYKKISKTLIYELDKNEDYLNNKLKKPSLGNIWLARNAYQGIDENFNLIKDLNIADYLK